MKRYSIHYFKDNKLFSFDVEKFWHGELIYISISKLIVIIDNRKNWVKDMVEGGAE